MGLFDGLFGGGDQEITTTTELPPFLNLRLQDEIGRLEHIANTPTTFFPGQTFADRSPVQMEARANILDMARGGSPLVDAGQQSLMDTLSGRFLTPDAIGQAAAPFINRAVPGINNAFAAMGRGGSGAQARAVSEGIGNALGNVFQGERNRMMSALSAVPTFEDLRFNPARQLASVGRSDRAFNQQQINEQMARHQFAQTEEFNRRNAFLNQLLASGGVAGGTVTQSAPNQSSPLANILGLGLTGLGVAGGLGWQPFASPTIGGGGGSFSDLFPAGVTGV